MLFCVGAFFGADGEADPSWPDYITGKKTG